MFLLLSATHRAAHLTGMTSDCNNWQAHERKCSLVHVGLLNGHREKGVELRNKPIPSTTMIVENYVNSWGGGGSLSSIGFILKNKQTRKYENIF